MSADYTREERPEKFRLEDHLDGTTPHPVLPFGLVPNLLVAKVGRVRYLVNRDLKSLDFLLEESRRFAWTR